MCLSAKISCSLDGGCASAKGDAVAGRPCCLDFTNSLTSESVSSVAVTPSPLARFVCTRSENCSLASDSRCSVSGKYLWKKRPVVKCGLLLETLSGQKVGLTARGQQQTLQACFMCKPSPPLHPHNNKPPQPQNNNKTTPAPKWQQNHPCPKMTTTKSTPPAKWHQQNHPTTKTTLPPKQQNHPTPKTTLPPKQ